MKNFISEFIGTLFLVFIGAGSAVMGIGLVGISLAFGFIVLAVVYTLGNVSGAHINPAVTISLLVNGKINITQACSYIVAQVLGATVAALLILLAVGTTASGLGVTGLAVAAEINGVSVTVSPFIGMIIEMIGTFILVLTVYGAAVGKGSSNLAGIAIGLVVSAVIFTIGPLTSASINPARSIGPAIVAGNYTDLWVYIVGPILGGILAGLVFKVVDKD